MYVIGGETLKIKTMLAMELEDGTVINEQDSVTIELNNGDKISAVVSLIEYDSVLLEIGDVLEDWYFKDIKNIIKDF